MSWLFLRPGTGLPRLRHAFRTEEGTSRAVIDLGGAWDVTVDEAETARALAAAFTGAAEALDRLNPDAGRMARAERTDTKERLNRCP